MLRLFTVATVAMMVMGAISVSVGEISLPSMPHFVSTIFYGLSGR
jgi:hypothetical protein